MKMTKDLTLLFFAILTFAFLDSYNAEPIAEPVIEETGTRDSKGTFYSSQYDISFHIYSLKKLVKKSVYLCRHLIMFLIWVVSVVCTCVLFALHLGSEYINKQTVIQILFDQDLMSRDQ